MKLTSDDEDPADKDTGDSELDCQEGVADRVASSAMTGISLDDIGEVQEGDIKDRVGACNDYDGSEQYNELQPDSCIQTAEGGELDPQCPTEIG